MDVDWAMGHVVVSAALRGAGSVVAQPRLAARLELVVASLIAIASALVLVVEVGGLESAMPSLRISPQCYI